MLVLKQVGTVNYDKEAVPVDYRCDNCDAHKVRLWRQFQVEVSRTKLLCAICSEEDQKVFHKEGWQSQFSRGVGDTIGCYVPAVPIQGRNTYWGYPALPTDGIAWWRGLSIRR